jgi:ATP-binding cassette subfamily B protein/subfamily B ATP-binding cassette protein MsbA
MSVIVKHITFSYGDRVILNDINLYAAPGEQIGIVGVSGGGKSTLLKLIAGLYSQQSGIIRVNGANAQADRRRLVAMVTQSSMLFPASIRENITCGHLLSEDAVANAIKAAQLYSWIESLPEGLDSNVGERGGRISGGQAQRIAIARAIAKDAPVILLDEATSSLDNETGSAVLTALIELTAGKTVISVSHKPETLNGYDRVYKLEGGRLFDV